MKEQIKKEILTKLGHIDTWGVACNDLQDIAEQALPESSFMNYLIQANQDEDKSAEDDGVLLNGQYFDWHEYGPQKYEIVSAWLDYFTETDLKLILNFMTQEDK